MNVKTINARAAAASAVALLGVGFAALMPVPALAATTQVGQVLVCYTCTNTGNPVIDAALAANPGVSSDGILFAFVNTSGSAIGGGVFDVSGASPNDSFTIQSIAAHSTFVLIPGVTDDGVTHPSGGLFELTGVKDTSDGAGGVSDSSSFSFVGFQGSDTIYSLTAGSSTPHRGSFTAGDPGLVFPAQDDPSDLVSFLGLGPDGDSGCYNCYFHKVATLDVDTGGPGVPEPAAWSLMLLGFGTVGGALRARPRPELA